jgi:hypothetical protein
LDDRFDVCFVAHCGHKSNLVGGLKSADSVEKVFFLELLIRFERGDVRDHIDSSKIDHGPS